MPTSTYWTRRLGRRTALRSAGALAGGLAGAALLGCGGDDASEGTGDTGTTSPNGSGGEGTAAPAEVRIAPGIYGASIPATAAESDPLTHGIAGGVLKGTYLDPPGMDLNRVLSCTVIHPTQYATNRLVRGKVGPLADTNQVAIEPDLAESWEASPDSLQFTFHLHQGVKTHNIDPTNGREYTSEDVRLTLERYRAGGTLVDIYSDVSSIETPDDYTVVVTLGAPRPDFAVDNAAWSAMFVRELIEDEEQLQQRLVGTGPFIQEEWTQKERSVFRKHPEYFKAGLPFLDGLEMYVQNDSAASRAGFQTDNYFTVSAANDDEADVLLRQNEDTFVMTKQPLANNPNTRGWWFQMTNPKLSYPRVEATPQAR